MDQWQQFAQNIQGAQGSGDIYTNYAVSKSGQDRTTAAKAGPAAAVQAKTDDAIRANAANAAQIAAKQQSDATDPSKYQMVLLPDNKGYAFYDGTGKQIGINQYSLATGKTPAQLLQNSPNPKDQKFVQDYNTLQTLSTAWVNGDTKTLTALRSADPNKFNQLISTYKTPADMVSGFVKHWGDYYTPNQNKDTSATPSFGPQPINNTPAAQQPQGNLGQVLTPQPKAPPQESFWDKLNPWSANHKAVNSYNQQIKSNPWFAYHNSLYGS